MRKDDIIYRILNNLASRISTELKKRNIKRKVSYTDFLGCTPQVFKTYLENKFENGMSFENYGKWEIDHIYPISKVNFDSNIDINKCFNYKICNHYGNLII